ncbi:MAG TPA: hypothetical protein VGM92_11110 [Candidatus Kapabacteria bacterium]
MKPILSLLVFLTMFASSAMATTHIVQATYNTDQNKFFYVPADSFLVHVGDTIDWKMDFTTHTLLVQWNGTNMVDSGGTSTIPPAEWIFFMSCRRLECIHSVAPSILRR